MEAGWSPLRITVLTCVPGAAGLLIANVIAIAAGIATVPSVAAVASVGVEIAYFSICSVVLGVLGFNFSVRNLGPLNTMLMLNLVPVCGFAIEAGAKYRLGGSLLPWVELKFTLLSGDDDQSLTDTDCDAWLSYGNHADLMIIEDPFYGFGWNANEFAVKLSGGVALSMMGKTNNLRLRGIFGWCDATEDVTFASGREDRLGMEFDAMAEWEFHKQVTINGGFGLLMASQILEESLGGSSNANASSSSFLFTLGLAARF